MRLNKDTGECVLSECATATEATGAAADFATRAETGPPPSRTPPLRGLPAFTAVGRRGSGATGRAGGMLFIVGEGWGGSECRFPPA